MTSVQDVVSHIEYCVKVTPMNKVQYDQAVAHLMEFRNSPNPFEACFMLLQRRASPEAVFHALETLNAGMLRETNNGAFSSDNVNHICSTVLAFAAQNIDSLPQFIQNTICKVVSTCHLCALPIKQPTQGFLQLVLNNPSLLSGVLPTDPRNANPNDYHYLMTLVTNVDFGFETAVQYAEWIKGLQNYCLDISRNIMQLFTSNNQSFLYFSTIYMQTLVAESNFMIRPVYDALLLKRILIHLLIQQLFLPFFATLLLQNLQKTTNLLSQCPILTLSTLRQIESKQANSDSTPPFTLLYALLKALTCCFEWKRVEEDLLTLVEASNKTSSSLPTPSNDTEDNADSTPSGSKNTHQQQQQQEMMNVVTRLDNERVIDSYASVVFGHEWTPILVGLNTPQSTQPVLPSHDFLLGRAERVCDGTIYSQGGIAKNTFRMFDVIFASPTNDLISTHQSQHTQHPQNRNVQSTQQIQPVAFTIMSLYSLLLYLSSTPFYSQHYTLRRNTLAGQNGQNDFFSDTPPHNGQNNSSQTQTLNDLHQQYTTTKDLLDSISNVRGSVVPGTSPVIYRCMGVIAELIVMLFQIHGECFLTPHTSPITIPTLTVPNHATTSSILINNIHYRNHVYWLMNGVCLSVFDFVLQSHLYHHLNQTAGIISHLTNTPYIITEPTDEMTRAGADAIRMISTGLIVTEPYVLSTIPIILPIEKILLLQTSLLSSSHNPQNASNGKKIDLFSTFFDFDWVKTALNTTLINTLPREVLRSLPFAQAEVQSYDQYIQAIRFSESYCTTAPCESFTNSTQFQDALAQNPQNPQNPPPNPSQNSYQTQTRYTWVTFLPHLLTTLLLSRLYPNIPTHSSSYMATTGSLLQPLALEEQLALPSQHLNPSQPTKLAQTNTLATTPVDLSLYYDNAALGRLVGVDYGNDQNGPTVSKFTQMTKQFSFLPFAHNDDESSIRFNFNPLISNIAFHFEYRLSAVQSVIEAQDNGHRQENGGNVMNHPGYGNGDYNFSLPLSFHKQLISHYTSHTSWCADIINQVREVVRLLAVRDQKQQEIGIQHILWLLQRTPFEALLPPQRSTPIQSLSSTNHLLSTLTVAALQLQEAEKKQQQSQQQQQAICGGIAMMIPGNPTHGGCDGVYGSSVVGSRNNVDFSELFHTTTPSLSLYNTKAIAMGLFLVPSYIQSWIYSFISISIISTVSIDSITEPAGAGNEHNKRNNNSNFVGDLSFSSSLNNANDDDDDDWYEDDQQQAMNDYIDDVYTQDTIISLATLLRSDFVVSTSVLNTTIRILTKQLITKHQKTCLTRNSPHPHSLTNTPLDVLEPLTFLYKLSHHFLHNSARGETTSIPSHNLLFQLISNLILSLISTPNYLSNQYNAFKSYQMQLRATNKPMVMLIAPEVTSDQQWIDVIFSLPQTLIDLSSCYTLQLLPQSFHAPVASHSITAFSTCSNEKCGCLSARLMGTMTHFLAEYSSTHLQLYISQFTAPQQQDLFQLNWYKGLMNNNNHNNQSQLEQLTPQRLVALNQERFIARSSSSFFHPQLCSIFGSYHTFIPNFSTQTLSKLFSISQNLLLLWSEDRDIIRSTCSLVSKCLPLLFHLPTHPDMIFDSLVSFSNIYLFYTLSSRTFQSVLQQHWEQQYQFILAQQATGANGANNGNNNSQSGIFGTISASQSYQSTQQQLPGQLIQFGTFPTEVVSILTHKQAQLDQFIQSTQQNGTKQPLLLYTLTNGDDNSILSIGHFVLEFLYQSIDFTKTFPSSYQLQTLSPPPSPNHLQLSLLREFTITFFQNIVSLVVLRHQSLVSSTPSLPTLQQLGHTILFGTTLTTLSNTLLLKPSTTPSSQPQYNGLFGSFERLIGLLMGHYQSVDSNPTLLDPKALLKNIVFQDFYPLLLSNLTQITTLITSPLSQLSPTHFALIMTLFNDYLAIITVLVQFSVKWGEKWPFSEDLLDLIESTLSLLSSLLDQHSISMSFMLFSLLSTSITAFVTMMTQEEVLKMIYSLKHEKKLNSLLNKQQSTTNHQLNTSTPSLNLLSNSIDPSQLGITYHGSESDDDDDDDDEDDFFNSLKNNGGNDSNSFSILHKKDVFSACSDIIRNILNQTSLSNGSEPIEYGMLQQLAAPISPLTTNLSTMTHTQSVDELIKAGVFPCLFIPSVFNSFTVSEVQQNKPVLVPAPLYPSLLLLKALGNLLSVVQLTPTPRPFNSHKYSSLLTSPSDQIPLPVQYITGGISIGGAHSGGQNIRGLKWPLFLTKPNLTLSILQTLVLAAKTTFPTTLYSYNSIILQTSPLQLQGDGVGLPAVQLTALCNPLFDFVLTCLQQPQRFSLLHDDIIKHSFTFLSLVVEVHNTFLKTMVSVCAQQRQTRALGKQVQLSMRTTLEQSAQTNPPPGGVFIRNPQQQQNVDNIQPGVVDISGFDSIVQGQLLILNASPNLIQNVWLSRLIPTTYFINTYCWPICLSIVFVSQLQSVMQANRCGVATLQQIYVPMLTLQEFQQNKLLTQLHQTPPPQQPQHQFIPSPSIKFIPPPLNHNVNELMASLQQNRLDPSHYPIFQNFIPTSSSSHSPTQPPSSHNQHIANPTSSQDVQDLFYLLLMSLTGPDDMVHALAQSQLNALKMANNNNPNPSQPLTISSHNQIQQLVAPPSWMPYYYQTRNIFFRNIFCPVTANENEFPMGPLLVRCIEDFFENLIVTMLREIESQIPSSSLSPTSLQSSNSSSSGSSQLSLTSLRQSYSPVAGNDIAKDLSNTDKSVFYPLTPEQLTESRHHLHPSLTSSSSRGGMRPMGGGRSPLDGIAAVYPYSLSGDSRGSRKTFFAILKSLLTQLRFK